MPRLLTADEAARRLGVRKTTLYTYASRGWLNPVRDGRTSRYPEREVESLRIRADSVHGHDAAAASALDWGAPILASAITSIDASGPRYRGHAAVDLAERDTPFEAVFDLLVDGVLPSGPGSPVPTIGPPLDPAPGDSLFAGLAVVLALAVARDELRLVLGGDLERTRRRALVRRLVVGVGHPERSATAPTVARALAEALGAPVAAAPTLQRALVVCADHELNASTFAARVAAGTGADTGSCLVAALATLSGPRHGGQTVAVQRLVEPVVDAASGRRVLADALATHGSVPGFGHRLYPDGDPRATALLRWADGVDPTATRPLRAFADHVRDTIGEHPTLDLGLVALARALRLPPRGAPALFAVGRSAGWIAHVDEQRRSGRMLRPRAA